MNMNVHCPKNHDKQDLYIISRSARTGSLFNNKWDLIIMINYYSTYELFHKIKRCYVASLSIPL